MNINIEYLSVNDLTPYEKNTRVHTDYDVGQIAKSIEKYGMNDPIGVWGKQNLIVEGHGRLQACKQLGIDKVPVIRLDHLTDEQRREYAIMHNKTAELSIWDFANLDTELADLDFSDFDIQLGFDIPDFSEAFEDGIIDKPAREKDFFEMSFVLPREYEIKANKYVKDNGKDGIVELIIAEIKSYAEEVENGD